MRDYAMVRTELMKDLSHTLPANWDPEHFTLGLADAEGWTDTQVAGALQYQSLFKKLAPGGQTESAIAKTLEKFSAINAAVSFEPPNSGDCESMVYMLNLFRDEVWKCLDFEIDGRNFDMDYLSDHFAAGPGASRGANSRNFYTKLFDSNHSYTEPYVLALFRAATSRSETWQLALRAWSKSFRPVVVKGNSLFTVKKNTEISRTCCTEPLLNMLLQKALGDFAEERLARWGISLDVQPDVNREMARLGSIDGAFGTTDLSSASDSIAVSLCEWAIPPTFYKWLRLFRSANVRYPDGREEKLNMISTMGNGFTFPLETIIFASAIRAVYIAKGLNPCFVGIGRNAAVFGDDIIVRKDCFDTINNLLLRLGFAVNESKSFNSGSFRESCGFDYWKGRNIRPVFIESLETPQDVYSSFNRLSRWSAENRIPIGRTLFALSKMARFLPIPFSWADDSGFKVPVSRAPLEWSENMWHKFKFLKPISTVQRVPKDPREAKALGYKDFNPYGWELCFLGGYARNPLGTFSSPKTVSLTCVNSETVNTRQYDGINRRPFQGEVLPRRRCSGTIPYWDWFGAEDVGRFGRHSFHYWEVMVAQIF